MQDEQLFQMILESFKKMAGPEWNLKGALQDFNSETPSEGAKAFKEFIGLLNPHVEIKTPYHRAIESINVISAQKYLDESSRESALLRIRGLVDEVIPQKNSFLTEQDIHKINIAFEIKRGSKFVQEFVTRVNSARIPLQTCTESDLRGMMFDWFPPTYDLDMIHGVSQILKLAFPSV
jgi:hypothetical protein